MQPIWSVRISSAFSGVTKISVESGVRNASVKPAATQPSADSLSCARQIDGAAAGADLERAPHARRPARRCRRPGVRDRSCNSLRKPLRTAEE